MIQQLRMYHQFELFGQMHHPSLPLVVDGCCLARVLPHLFGFIDVPDSTQNRMSTFSKYSSEIRSSTAYSRIPVPKPHIHNRIDHSQHRPYFPKRKHNVKVFQDFISERSHLESLVKRSGSSAHQVVEGLKSMFRLTKEYENNDYEVELSHNLDWKQRIVARNKDLESTKKRENMERDKLETNIKASAEEEPNYDTAMKKLLRMSCGLHQYGREKMENIYRLDLSEFDSGFQQTPDQSVREIFEEEHDRSVRLNERQNMVIEMASHRLEPKPETKPMGTLSRHTNKGNITKSHRASRLQKQVQSFIHYASQNKRLRFPKTHQFNSIEEDSRSALLAIPLIRSHQPSVSEPRPRSLMSSMDYSVPRSLISSLQSREAFKATRVVSSSPGSNVSAWGVVSATGVRY